MEKSLLKLATVGSVDDGKSTLIGRLLYETNCIYEDQYESVKKISQKKGSNEVDLSLFLDGLSAEREQGITIDVAYKYFSTDKRKFIIADCPGHEQYTRNMITGASNSDLAIILIDARNGIMTQSKRHSFLVSLLGIQNLVVTINKMDLINYDQTTYNKIVNEFTKFVEKLNISNVIFIPISSLKGDNVIKLSPKMSWYKGPSLLNYLENVQVKLSQNQIDFRFPVQLVNRPHLNFRGYNGTVISGSIKKGDDVIILPSRIESKIKTIEAFKQTFDKAETGQAVVLTLEDEIDISRGDMIVKKQNFPIIHNQFEATLCCLNDKIIPNKQYVIKHTTHSIKAYISNIQYKIDMNTLHKQEVEELLLNDIGKVKIKTTKDLFFDPYQINKLTGSFILIDELTNQTVACGMIKSEVREIEKKSTNVIYEQIPINKKDWEKLNGHKAKVFWFTGISASGKSTIAKEFLKQLYDEGKHCVLLDGDNLRLSINADLGFTNEDRNKNIQRTSQIANLFYEQGNIVLCSLISPIEKSRNDARKLFPCGDFVEVFVKCDINICKVRNPKGLYSKNINNFTGITSTYQGPKNPEIILDTTKLTIQESVNILKKYII